MNLVRTLYTISILLSVFLITACQNEGPAEKAGSRIDEIADNVKEGEAPLKEKGPLEKAGEAVDDTLKK